MNTESNRGAMSNNRFELISCHSVIIQSSYTMAIKRVAIYSHTKGSICSLKAHWPLPHLINNRALCDSHTHFVFVFTPYYLHACIVNVIVFVFVFFTVFVFVIVFSLVRSSHVNTLIICLTSHKSLSLLWYLSFFLLVRSCLLITLIKCL